MRPLGWTARSTGIDEETDHVGVAVEHSVLTHRIAMYRIARDERRDTQRPPRPALARRAAVAPGPWLRDRGHTPGPQRRCVRSSRRHPLSGGASSPSDPAACRLLVR